MLCYVFLLLMLLFGRLSCLSIFILFLEGLTNLAESSKLYRVVFSFSFVWNYFSSFLISLTHRFSPEVCLASTCLCFSVGSSIDVTGRKMLNIVYPYIYWGLLLDLVNLSWNIPCALQRNWEILAHRWYDLRVSSKSTDVLYHFKTMIDLFVFTILSVFLFNVTGLIQSSRE